MQKFAFLKRKKWWSLLPVGLVALLLGTTAATINYIPRPIAGMVSSDGSGNAGTWQPLTGSGGTSINYVPPIAGLYYSTDGTGNPGTWAPWNPTAGTSGFPITLGSTSIAANSTTTGIAGLGLNYASGNSSTSTYVASFGNPSGGTQTVLPFLFNGTPEAQFRVDNGGDFILAAAGGSIFIGYPDIGGFTAPVQLAGSSFIVSPTNAATTSNYVLNSAGTQTVSGCSLTTAVGGSWAGSFHSGTTGTCTVTITPGNTAAHGYSCWANDLTTTADKLNQTATTTTTATIAGTTASGDVITWGCVAY